MKTQKKTNKYVKKHTEKVLQESYEAEFFQALGQSFQPIVDTISSMFQGLSDVVGQGLIFAKSSAQDASSVADELRRLLKYVQEAKGEFDKSLSGFTKEEQKFFKKKIVEVLKMLINDPKKLVQVVQNKEKLEAEISKYLDEAQNLARLARKFDIRKLVPNSQTELEEMNRIKYKGKQVARQDFQDLLMNQTKIKDVFDLIAKNYDNLIKYIKQELVTLEQYKKEEGLLSSLLQRSVLLVIHLRVKTHLRKMKRAEELLKDEDFRKEYFTVDVVNKLQQMIDKGEQQQELREFKEFLKGRRLI